MSDTDRLAELLIEVFPAANRNQWPFAATDVAAALIAAGVRVAPSPETPGLRAAAQAVVDSALLTEFGPDEEFWTVHSEALAALRAALAESQP